MIAGHDAYRVNFISKDAHRYNRHLWIAKSTYMLLKMDISNDMGEVLESCEFSQIDVDIDIPKSEFSHKDFVRHQAKHFEKASEKNQEKQSQMNIEENDWKASWLPQGFYFSGSSHELTKYNEQDKQHALELLMYTDGLSAISVFIEEVEHKSVFNESSQQGAVSAYSEVHVVDGKHVMVTSIGDVPLPSLERITKGMVFRN
jgi:sigma-E factor negative regulatory protein RseB